jgi:hypothetical protein
MRMVKGKLHTEASRLAGPHLVKWLKITSVVYKVAVNEALGMVFLDETKIILEFDKKWGDKLHLLYRGQVISVVGQLRSVRESGIEAENCELV